MKFKQYSYFLPYIIFICMIVYQWSLVVPHEDAHIIFRYAKNISEGAGYRYNATDCIQIEGSSELLWTYILSLSLLLKINVVLFSRICGIIIGLISLRLLERKVYPYSLVSCIYSMSPIAYIILSGFGTPLFILTLILAFKFYRNSQVLFFALFLSLAFLCRVETAVVIVLLFTFNFILEKQYRLFVVPAVSIAVIWFLKYLYFGEWMPNAFYTKHGNELLHVESIYPLLITYASISPILFILSFKKVRWAMNKIDVYTVLSFPLCYLLIEQSQNIGYRFELPVMILLLLFITKRNHLYAGDGTETKWVLSFLAIVLFAQVIQLYAVDYPKYDERKAIGENLCGKNAVICTTEAGWLPYYSNFTTMDAGGLCDKTTLRYGVREEWLVSGNPDIITWHCYSDVYLDQWSNSDNRWNEITHALYNYAEKNKYILTAVYGTSNRDCRWYYVKKGREDLIDGIIQIDSPYRGKIMKVAK